MFFFYGGLNSPSIGSAGEAVLNVSNRKADIRKPVFDVGNLINLIREMNRLQVDIMGVSGTCWLGTGKCSVENGTFSNFGYEDQGP